MRRMTIDDLNFSGRKALMRVDFNVPLNEHGEISNDYRIVSTLPSIKKILNDGGSVICMSHLGRPKGEQKPEFSLKPVQSRLAELLGVKVHFAPDCIGEEAIKLSKALQPGEILLLENLRFYKEEEKNGADFSKKLATLGDVYVNDAFGTSHRAHASTVGVTEYFDQIISGYLLEKELIYLKDKMEAPERPYSAILGGAKISGKIDTINFMIGKVDNLIIGGGMAYTFYKAMGREIGSSLLEEDKIELAAEIIEKAKAANVNLLLPVDNIVAPEFKNESPATVVSADGIPAEQMGLDIGPATIALFGKIILNSKTILWNGPMGVFEFENFAGGTNAVAKLLAEATASGAVTVVGGGDSVAAVKKGGFNKKMSHVSTGGGASLELLSGLTLPAVAKITMIE
ncbi:MAG TPA: phosphoglycerate kinase [Candidatus Marinimicrobia bacterium]|nr:phosphoglycerate kinase [Candidatus Neomarinimicrobiota bacterium]